MQPRISMITLGTRNFKRAVTFYEALGFPRREGDGEKIAFFPLNGTWLALYDREELAEDATVPPKGEGFEGITLAYNVHSKEEADQVMEEAEAAGATVVKPMQEVFWGGYSGYFKDPEGHLWEVAWNPFSWIGPEDCPGE
ncbi:MAG TPA: VOC family protein [Synergistaceae bacterium]|nr:VOC family protein [Synergistaceae bacterium]HPQ36016.1 VOC family protein [Synergistaceae bacterium]